MHQKCYTGRNCCFLQVIELLFITLIISLLVLFCVFATWFCSPHSPAIMLAWVSCSHLCSRCNTVPQQFKPPKRQDYSDAGTAVPQFTLTLPPKPWSHIASDALYSPHACSSHLRLPTHLFGCLLSQTMDLIWLKTKQAPQLLHEHVCVCTHTSMPLELL